jgi:hypothetical protein
MQRVESLPAELQRKLLAYCDTFEHSSLRGENGSALVSFSGRLDDVSALEMSKAIQQACEGIDAREW